MTETLIKEIIVNKNFSSDENSNKDGSVQFRLDADKLELLNRVAAQKRTGAGVLARMWVIERLEKETGGKGSVGIDPLELVADSMKALSNVLGVQNFTQQVNERLDELEKKIQHVNLQNVSLPRLKPIKTTKGGKATKGAKATQAKAKTTKPAKAKKSASK